MNILDFLVEPLTPPFMLRAWSRGLPPPSALCSPAGSCCSAGHLWGDAISHAVLPVVVAYIFGAPFAVVWSLPPSWR